MKECPTVNRPQTACFPITGTSNRAYECVKECQMCRPKLYNLPYINMYVYV